jgi:hypothetical protein
VAPDIVELLDDQVLDAEIEEGNVVTLRPQPVDGRRPNL